jgi:hypothetical protein
MTNQLFLQASQGGIFSFIPTIIVIVIVYFAYRTFKNRSSKLPKSNTHNSTNDTSSDSITTSGDSFSGKEKNSIGYVKWIIANAGAKMMLGMINAGIAAAIGIITPLIALNLSSGTAIQDATYLGGIMSTIFSFIAIYQMWQAAKMMRNI